MQLYLIRHGQSYVNLPDWDKGYSDEGLTELGQEQARRLAAWLPSHLSSVDVLYASTMRRARETAAAVAGAYEVEVQFDDRLREVGNNRLDHTPWPNDALPLNYADYWFSSRPFSPIILDELNGETFMHFRTRVGLFVEALVDRHLGQVVLVVAHGGVVESVFDHVFNIGPWKRCEVWDHNTAVTRFEYVEHPGREVWRLHYHNRTEHLIGLDTSAA
jgi:probable phosphoglycerate mutase